MLSSRACVIASCTAEFSLYFLRLGLGRLSDLQGNTAIPDPEEQNDAKMIWRQFPIVTIRKTTQRVTRTRQMNPRALRIGRCSVLEDQTGCEGKS